MISLHITTKDSHISVTNQTLLIQLPTEEISHPLGYINALYIYPKVSLETEVVRKCHDHQVNIYFCKKEGYVYSSIGHPYIGDRANIVSKQLRMSITTTAKKLAAQWLENKELLRIELLNKNVPKETLKSSLFEKYKISVNACINFLGQESSLAKMYYKLYSKSLPSEMQFTHRTRRPARDFTNAVLNYLYSLLYTVVEKLIMKHRMDIHIGFHHGMARRGKAFLYDVIEPFRPHVEAMILINADRLIPYVQDLAYLSWQCRKELIKLFYEYLYDNNKMIYKSINDDIKQISETIKRYEYE